LQIVSFAVAAEALPGKTRLPHEPLSPIPVAYHRCERIGLDIIRANGPSVQFAALLGHIADTSHFKSASTQAGGLVRRSKVILKTKLHTALCLGEKLVVAEIYSTIHESCKQIP